MIPSTNNKLLVTEDWRKIYQSFRNSDFKSYDFDTLRRTMITYLQENYPEDFNDFIESSEYIALIDLIAYLGQNLSFRIDLNARENFIETAQRRDSILRLAQLVSYVPSRNTPANGFLKVSAIATSDTVIDSNGINLSNITISWNDAANPNWYNQFITIINSAMSGSFAFGKPYDRATIDGILTEQYRINSSNTDLPTYGFLKNINGTQMNFEIVPASFSGKTSIYEEAPEPGNTFSLIYKNDNQGSGSANTGFFCHFRQGTMAVSSFNIDTPVANEIIGVNAADINNTDVWLWQLDASGAYDILWTKVSDVVGNNVIYNSLNKDERNIYSVTSRDRDQIDLNFADGSFGNLPKGRFNVFYRQSNGLTYVIKPEQMKGVVVEIPYRNRNGQSHTLTLTLSLQYTVNNSSGPESNASIQNKAPQAYYIQNRMVTAEDYNIAPLTLGNDILKVKSVNRVSSGISKYFELSDVSGKYSSTNIFADDGILYQTNKQESFEFEFGNRNELFAVIKQQLEPIVASTEMRSFYLNELNFPRANLVESVLPIRREWRQVNKVSNQSRGYFAEVNTITDEESPVSLGMFTSNNLRFVEPGALIKFVPPAGKYFLPNGKIVSNPVDRPNYKTVSYLWLKVIQVVGDGSNSGQGALDDGTGPVILSGSLEGNDTVGYPIPAAIIPKFTSIWSYAFENELVNLCLNQRNFGLSFNHLTGTWNIVLDTNLNINGVFSLQDRGNIENSNKDASWLIAFLWTGKNYKVQYRISEYIFESQKQTAFFIDRDNINYDFTNNSIVKDQINILSINPAVTPTLAANTATFGTLGKNYQWQVDSAIIEPDGFVEPKKVKVSFYDYNNSGEIDDPDSFTNVVEPMSISEVTGARDQFVYFKRLADGLRYDLVPEYEVMAYSDEDSVPLVDRVDGQLYYFYDETINVVKRYDASKADSDPWVFESDYFAYPGRSGIKFQYVHNTGEDRRIDPSKSNIIDVYLLTAAYDSEYRIWLSSGTGIEPLAPTSQSLDQNFGGALELYKTISDEIVFQPVKYKVLFGNKADINLQATFKAVRNPDRPVSDNDLKTRILESINSFFSLENWDFGQSFHFSELSAYVMNSLTPDITNFVIVPKSNSSFGSLYEISCLSNEIFISGATVSDIEIIGAITATELKTTSIITSGN